MKKIGKYLIAFILLLTNTLVFHAVEDSNSDTSGTQMEIVSNENQEEKEQEEYVEKDDIELKEISINQQELNGNETDKKDHILYETDEYIVYDDYSVEGKGSTTTINGNGQMIMLAHMSSLNAYVGQQVTKGTKVGVMGSTGISYGAHVHVERWSYTTTSLPACGDRINPNDYLNVFNSGYDVTQWYGNYAGPYACGGYHKGTDIVPTGSDWSVNSPTQGIVRKAAHDDVFGYHVVIEINEHMNIGNLDHLSVSDMYISTSGWSFDTNATGQRRFIFVIDAVTGLELGRTEVSKVGRGDVCNVYGHITNCGNSGFSVDIPIKDNMRGKTIKIMARYTNDSGGNDSKSDYWFSNTIKVPSVPNTITDGNIKYYLNSDWTIKYAEELNKEIVTKRFHFYSGAKYDGNQKSEIQYEFQLNSTGNITRAINYENKSQKIKKIYEYYDGAHMGEYVPYIKNIFYIDGNNNIKYAAQYSNGNGGKTPIRYFEYYENTIYGTNHYTHLKYTFHLNTDETIKYVDMFEDGSSGKQKLRILEYYTGTKYGENHYAHLMNVFVLNADESIQYAEQYENNSSPKKMTKAFEYYTGTKYGENHYSHIKYIFVIDDNGFINYALGREDGIVKDKEKIEYLPNTKYRENHGSRILRRYPI